MRHIALLLNNFFMQVTFLPPCKDLNKMNETTYKEYKIYLYKMMMLAINIKKYIKQQLSTQISLKHSHLRVPAM